MPTEFAHEDDQVKSIRKKLLDELNADTIFVAWKDRSAKMVKMVIEGESIVNRKYFDSIVEEMLPHGVFSYETYPSNGLRDHAETHILFHV